MATITLSNVYESALVRFEIGCTEFRLPQQSAGGSYISSASIDATATDTATAQAITSSLSQSARLRLIWAPLSAGGTSIKVDPGHNGTASITITNSGM